MKKWILNRYKALKHLILFSFKDWMHCLRERRDKRFLRRCYSLLAFTFKLLLWEKWVWIQSQESFVVFRGSKVFLLNILFSTRLIVGWSVIFQEYLLDYIKPIKYLIFAKIKYFALKLFNLCCLNRKLLKKELVKINHSLFIFYSLVKGQISCTLFRASFFNYVLVLKKENLYIVKSSNCLMKVSFQQFFYFFKYLEHFRTTKYNEYVTNHFLLNKTSCNFRLRKLYMDLYFDWRLGIQTLEEGYIAGFRKGLLYKYYFLYFGSYAKEKQIGYILTRTEFINMFFNANFNFLYVIKRLLPFNKFLFHLNRQGIRNTVRFLTYARVMQKDRKWKWFHVRSFETIKDFIFWAFRKHSSVQVYLVLTKWAERKLLNWTIRQSYFTTNYFLRDLQLFTKWKPKFFEVYYWNEIFFFWQIMKFLLTNLFNTFMIRLASQVDFQNPLMGTYIFSYRYAEEFYCRLLFYSLTSTITTAELFLGLDYFLWRIWYNLPFNKYKTFESYIFTASYDKILLSRYLGLLRLYQNLSRKKNKHKTFDLKVFSLYILIRDLFYKTVKTKCRVLVLIFFINLNLRNNVNNIYWYDYKLKTSRKFFRSIAPLYERCIDLTYITAPDLLYKKN